MQTVLEAIRFQERGWLRNEEDSLSRRRVSLYYSLGYALQVRDEPEYLDEAVAAYQRAVEIYPALRKGWAFLTWV